MSYNDNFEAILRIADDDLEMESIPKHVGILCTTDESGHEDLHHSSTVEGITQPENIKDLVVGLEKNVPLWAKNQTLYWDFDEASWNRRYRNAKEVMTYVKKAWEQALQMWGFNPIEIVYSKNPVDFRIVAALRDIGDDRKGYVMASAFFPTNVEQNVIIYPKLFDNNFIDERRRIDVLIHEIGHIWGLRHFFAPLEEKDAKSVLFGKQLERTIMNYGTDSTLTQQDVDDLKDLYNKAWNGLKKVQDLPIRLQSTHTTSSKLKTTTRDDLFALTEDKPTSNHTRCDTQRDTEPIGSINKLVVGLDNQIPLWQPKQTLFWGFDVRSFRRKYRNANDVMVRVKLMFEKAVSNWVFNPINLVYSEDPVDFRISMKMEDDGDEDGWVMAAAFFPTNIRETVYIYPKFFEKGFLTEQQRIETLEHEIGHIWGLRHYFAPKQEKEFPSVTFGVHKEKTIMNYGKNSIMTQQDRDDLKRLYEEVWSGKLQEIDDMAVKLQFTSLTPKIEE